jgi:uncharacterized protein YegL
MKDNLTEIVAILDRSGSMADLAKDTIGGYNNFIEEQKKIPGEANVTTVLFDHIYDLLHDRVDIRNVPPITDKEYFARGNTALLDAVGKTINIIGAKLNAMKEEDRPSKVIVLIITDGAENASQEYTSDVVKEMVKKQTDVYNWQFLFFGANIDSFKVGKDLGINQNGIAGYSATKVGLDSVYSAMTSATSNYRATGKIDDAYKSDIK